MMFCPTLVAISILTKLMPEYSPSNRGASAPDYRAADIPATTMTMLAPLPIIGERLSTEVKFAIGLR
jgi:hypothetical protein